MGRIVKDVSTRIAPTVMPPPPTDRMEAIRCVLEMGIALSYDAPGIGGEEATRQETLIALRLLGVSEDELVAAGAPAQAS